MGDIWGAIAQYGLVPAIVGAVFYLLFYFGNKRAERKRAAQDEKDKREQVEVERNAELERQRLEKEKEVEKQKLESEKETRFMNIFKEMMTQLLNPPHTVEEQEESHKSNQFISHQLDCLVNEGADRAYMFSFHNGGKDLLGHGFLKMSMTQESIGENISPIMASYQVMPRMLFPRLYEELEQHEYYNVENVESLKSTDPHTYQFLTQHGVKSAMFRPIKDENGLMIGFVGMEYINKECDDKKKAYRNIDKKANRIMGALVGRMEN